MVIEAYSGGWGKEARQVLDAIVKRMTSVWNSEEEVASLRIAQRLSMTLQGENARAVLRRLGDAATAEAGLGGDFQTSEIDLWQ